MAVELQTVQASTAALAFTAQEIRAQKNLIQEVMRECMKDGEHFGTVPGCGPKKVLMKSGAETLSFTFKLAPTFEIQKTEMVNGHREYQITCVIKNAINGMILGSGVGSCSTMESKYRWRSGKLPDSPTEFMVPKSYWDSKRNGASPAELQTILAKEVGEAGRYATKKIDDSWVIMRRGEGTEERVENIDIADTYNTVLKMAKKRAHVDAILTVTAASDIFTQDLEENIEDRQAGASQDQQTQKPNQEQFQDVTPIVRKEVSEVLNLDDLKAYQHELQAKGLPWWAKAAVKIIADRKKEIESEIEVREMENQASERSA